VTESKGHALINDGRSPEGASTNSSLAPDGTDSHRGDTPARGALNNAGWNAFVTIWNIGISFVITPLMIRHLGIPQYGLLLLVWSVTGVLTITNLGIGEATLRYVSHHLADRNMAGVNRVFGSTLAFYVLVCLAVSLALVPASDTVATFIRMPPEAHSEVGWMLRAAALLFSVGMISNAFRSIPMALQRYDIASKVGFIQGFVRTVGFAVIVLLGYGVLYVIWWDVLVAIAILMVNVVLARRLLPGIEVRPKMSLPGFRETLSYGVFSFLTNIFLNAYRESGKLILGNHVGPSGVAFLGTPDSIAYRLYMVVVSGVETLMPRFSAVRNVEQAKTLLGNATQAALAVAVVLFVPMGTLMPDFLRLWINKDFAMHSAAAGRLLAISLIAPAGFAVIATYYRGIGKPGFVTVILALAGLVVLGSSVLLVRDYGPAGVAYGYLLSSIPWIGGIVWGWVAVYGLRTASRTLMRAVVVPLATAAMMFSVQITVRSYFNDVGWVGLLLLGACFSTLTTLCLVLLDCSFGGISLSRQVLARLTTSRHVADVRRRLQAWEAR
jgi:O-antigen/teichoic acid export membrane protein